MLVCLALVILCFFIIAREKKKNKSLSSENELSTNFYNSKEKYEYLGLEKSKTYEKILLLSSNKLKKIFCQKLFYSNIDFLLSLSKQIDEKINNDNKTYRSKNGHILIQEIASVVSSSILLSDKCNLFEKYKKISNIYKLKQKENKIFKILLGKQLLQKLYDIESEIINISKVIHKSKTTDKIKKYKKKILLLAEIYAIKKYNPNSTKILNKHKLDYNIIAKKLFSELKNAETKEKIIIYYLQTMFLK
ncbi:MAG: hypothetical protein IJX17_02710 [Clostridia bacterium]|nr:hypothetical protein [Clostridia bacterium]